MASVLRAALIAKTAAVIDLALVLCTASALVASKAAYQSTDLTDQDLEDLGKAQGDLLAASWLWILAQLVYLVGYNVTWEAFAQKKDFRRRIREIEVEMEEQSKLEQEKEAQGQGKGRPWWQPKGWPLWGGKDGAASSGAAAASKGVAAGGGAGLAA